MARMPAVQYGEGGAAPSGWTDLQHVYRTRLEYTTNHPGQLEVECGATGGAPPALLSCIRLLSYDVPGAGGRASIFTGRIDEVRPIHTTNVGHIWQIRARDYLAALADNTVGHPMESSSAAPMPQDTWGRRVPNWRLGCLDGQDPGGNCGRPRYAIVVALARSPRHAFTGHNSIGIDTGSDYITPDYLHTPTKSILQVIQELCDAGTWTEPIWPGRLRHGWDFGAGPVSPSYFHVFARGRDWWDQSIDWTWQEHGANRVTITDYKVFDHGYDVYTRAYSMGTGDVSGLEGNPTIASESYGMITPGVNDPYSLSYDKENKWNPAVGQFRIQRDTSEVRIGETDRDALTQGAQAKLEADGDDLYYKGRKMQITTIGIPLSTYGEPPFPGKKIWVRGIPGIAAQAFVISRWTYNAPDGHSVLDLGLPVYEAGLKMAEVQKLAHQGISGQHWVGPWWSTVGPEIAGGSDYGFYHNLGVMPRNVYVQIAKIVTHRSYYNCDQKGKEISAKCLYEPSISRGEMMHREEDGRWVGYSIMDAHKDYVKIRWAHFMGYSAGEAAGAGDPARGWLEMGWDTAFRIVVEA